MFNRKNVMIPWFLETVYFVERNLKATGSSRFTLINYNMYSDTQ